MNPQRISAIVWTILLVAFVSLGTASVAKRLDLRPPRIGAPLAGIDEPFEKILSVSDGSQHVLKTAAEIKPGAPVLVVGPGDDTAFCETFFSISYLLWPHPVWELGQVEAEKTPRFNLMPKQELKPAAMFLFRLQTPPEYSAMSHQIAPSLSKILIPENNR